MLTSVLVAYATRYGSTKEVADHVFVNPKGGHLFTENRAS